VFSDGAYEIIKPDGEMLSLDEFIGHLAARPRGASDRLEETMQFIDKARGGAAYADDVALVDITFG
jgi:sigma-B regulation protein RsbU (phosphoserine phosphatase)